MRAIAAAMLGMSLLLTSCAPPMKQYAFPAWGFVVSFSQPPKQTDQPASADGARPHNFLAEETTSGRDFVANATDISQSGKTADQFFDQVPDAVASGIGGTVASTTYVGTMAPAGAIVGREVRIAKGGKTAMVLRVFVAGGTLYQVGASSVLGPDDAAVKQFLDSFRLTGGGPGGAAATNAR